MPAKEVFGAQPPIELLRQWMDINGWYDRKAIGDFRHLVDINFVSAMGPPGGGRNQVTARLLRHFNFLALTEMEDQSKRTIFSTILKSWICKFFNRYYSFLMCFYVKISVATFFISICSTEIYIHM